jgi:hypothetical protein
MSWVPNDRHLIVEYQAVGRGRGEERGRWPTLQRCRHATLVFATRPGYPPIFDSSGGSAASLLSG